jgi:hypothetical protein
MVRVAFQPEGEIKDRLAGGDEHQNEVPSYGTAAERQYNLSHGFQPVEYSFDDATAP